MFNNPGEIVKATILVIEDESAIRLNICDWLELEGFNVHSAEDGFSGLRFAREFLIDLIICDINMPSLSGFEVFVELRKNVITARIPFIFLSATTDRETCQKAMQLGANDYISKPMKFNKLLEIITTQLSPQSQVNEEKIKHLCKVFE